MESSGHNPVFDRAMGLTQVSYGVSIFTFTPTADHGWFGPSRLGFATFASSWTEINLPSHVSSIRYREIEGCVAKCYQPIAVGRSDGVKTIELTLGEKEIFSRNMRNQDVFLLSDLGIVPDPTGAWKNGVFSVLATSENLKTLDVYLDTQGFPGLATLLPALSRRVAASGKFSRKFNHNQLFHELALPYLGT